MATGSSLPRIFSAAPVAVRTIPSLPSRHSLKWADLCSCAPCAEEKAFLSAGWVDEKGGEG